MRVAVPSDSNLGLQSTRSGHFGHSAYFTIVTIEGGEVTNVEVFKNVDHDTQGCGGVIQYALGLGIDAIIVRGMGQPPFRAFTQNGASVYIDGEAATVSEVIKKYIDGDLRQMSLDQAFMH